MTSDTRENFRKEAVVSAKEAKYFLDVEITDAIKSLADADKSWTPGQGVRTIDI